MTGRRMWGALLLSLALSSGCVTTARGRVYVRTGPPPVVVEARVPPPGAGYIWQPGFYRWDGRGYAWVPGRYERAPRPRATWIPGRWERDRRGWYYVEGHWRY